MNAETKTILIVEDDKDVALALATRLRAKNYNVLQAYDAVWATKLMSENALDLVLLDIGLPGGDGFLVAQRMHMQDNITDTPFIFITASKLPELRDKAEAFGAAGFFEKPYKPNVLMSSIEAALH